MDERPYADPNALTQPIPVVRVPPPPRPREPAVVRSSVAATVAPAPAPYAHRFGNIPWYVFARFAAFVLDRAGVAFVLATFGFHVMERGFVLFAGRDEGGFVTLAALSVGVALLIEFACELIFGTTLGKLVFGLRVRRRDGRRAGLLRIAVRSLLRPVDLLLIGPLLALFTPRHQRLGDLAAGTVVDGSRPAVLASLLGLSLAAALAYAQITFGGGLTSALGVVAETANYTPSLYARAVTALGLALPHPSTPAPSPAPQSSGTSNV